VLGAQEHQGQRRARGPPAEDQLELTGKTRFRAPRDALAISDVDEAAAF
jgi:hypothetical protein